MVSSAVARVILRFRRFALDGNADDVLELLGTGADEVLVPPRADVAA